MSYKELRSYQQAAIIYDLTVEFCTRYLDFKSRTTDQMTQAARSGKQNIVGGTAASKTSPVTEVRLLGVALLLRNCWKTTAIFCAKKILRLGKKTTRVLWKSGSLLTKIGRISRIRQIGRIGLI